MAGTRQRLSRRQLQHALRDGWRTYVACVEEHAPPKGLRLLENIAAGRV